MEPTKSVDDMIKKAFECKHENFVSNVKVTRLTDEHGNVTGYTTDIEVCCAGCMKPFEWIGFPYGVSPSHAATNIERTELRAPIKPVS